MYMNNELGGIGQLTKAGLEAVLVVLSGILHRMEITEESWVLYECSFRQCLIFLLSPPFPKHPLVWFVFIFYSYYQFISFCQKFGQDRKIQKLFSAFRFSLPFFLRLFYHRRKF